jgi:predicted PurR-regulated permease PerM
VPAVIAALAGHTHLHPVFAAAVTVVLFVAINEIGSKVLYPKLVGQALGLHTVLVLFVLFAGLEIDGIVGVLFAAPITALVIVAVVHLYRLWQELPDTLLSTVAKDDGRIAEHQPLP